MYDCHLHLMAEFVGILAFGHINSTLYALWSIGGVTIKVDSQLGVFIISDIVFKTAAKIHM